MSRFKSGVIYTNDNCIGCNKCISQCSILGANVSVIENGVSHIKVDSEKCNHCGKCIALCIHDARDYLDDVDDFFAALESGEKLSLLVAPSFYTLYAEQAEHILGYLKSIGVDKIYDVSYGAEISIWGHTKYLKEHMNLPAKERAYISQTCPALINVIELYNPDLIKKIIPVHSPMLCTAVYAHKYLGDKNRFAFLGPCISKKDEIISKKTENNVSFNVTYSHLMKHIGYKDFSTYSAKADLTSSHLGAIFPKNGSFKEAVSNFFPPDVNIIELTTLAKETFDTLRTCEGNTYEMAQPLMVDVLACKKGCYLGPGIENDKIDKEKLLAAYAKRKKDVYSNEIIDKNYDAVWANFEKNFEDLKYDDFVRTFEDRYHQPFHVPENVLNNIFDEMLKDTPEKRRINCGSCGYQSCYEMAKAIAYSYNRKENCIHYMHDEMTNRFYTDPQTKLPNRAAFVRDATQLVARNPDKQFVVLCSDVNRLKVVNDLHSFMVGNKVLCRIGEQLKQSCPGGIVARLGGGCFSIILEYTPDNMQRIYALKHFDCSDLGVKFPVTMRFGVYIRQNKEEIDVDLMMNCATICMDTSVSMAQNTFTLFTKDFRERMMLEANITTQMQPALDNNHFHLWFQPQYEVGTGVLIGAETLCRWIKDDGSMISPGLFIPIAEKNGFIRILDKYIWRQAFMAMRKWLDEGLNPVPISINISRVSLESEALIFIIKRLGDEFKIPTELIHFEITESAYMNDQQNLLYRINEIRKLGYKIAMDDFGSGYSSLNSLKDIPIDILKLDMGFMRSSTNIDKGGTIISSVVKMAQALKLTTIAEGVESESQASFLESVGCDIIQGFLYAKPMPEGKYKELISNL